MQAFSSISSNIVPLPLKDVDTDMIIPAQYLTAVSREGFGQHLFCRLRESDPHFPFNQERYAGAQILVSGSNFGCGSSREHAVWALLGAGIRVLLAPSFADIFYGNALKNGLLVIRISELLCSELCAAAEHGDCRITVSLHDQTITLGDGRIETFDFDPFRKHCILRGLDDIDYILDHKREIEAFRNSHCRDKAV